VFLIFGSKSEFYQEAKCLKKNTFCDLKCEKDGLENGFVPLCGFLHTEEKSENNANLKNLPPLRLPETIVKKERKKKQ
jgi:hypothetical protein